MNHYTITVKWSDADKTYVVFLPEWEDVLLQPCADGKTYSEALAHGEEVLEDMIGTFKAEGRPLPQAKTYA